MLIRFFFLSSLLVMLPKITHSAENLLEAVQNRSVVCSEPGGHCPPQLAQIYKWEKNPLSQKMGLGLCSAFLVEDDLLLTSAHCIPKELLQDQNLDCSQHLLVSFPEVSGYEASTFECAQVIFASDISRMPLVRKSDVALIQVKKKVPRPIFPLNFAPVEEGQALTSWAVNPSETRRGLISTLVKRTCRVLFNPIYNPQAQGALSPQLEMEGCELVGGNSGSPLLDQNMQVRAISHFNRSYAQVSMEYALMVEDDDWATPGRIGASGISCVDLKQRKLAAHCQGAYSKEEMIASFDQLIHQSLPFPSLSKWENFRERWQMILEQDLPGIKWEGIILDSADRQAKKIFYQMRPRCYESLEKIQDGRPMTLRHQLAPFCRINVKLNTHLKINGSTLGACYAQQAEMKSEFSVKGEEVQYRLSYHSKIADMPSDLLPLALVGTLPRCTQ